MRFSVRFSEGLTQTAGAACSMWSGADSEARFHSGDWVRGCPPGLVRENTAFSEKKLLPITHESERQRRPSPSNASLDSTAT